MKTIKLQLKLSLTFFLTAICLSTYAQQTVTGSIGTINKPTPKFGFNGTGLVPPRPSNTFTFLTMNLNKTFSILNLIVALMIAIPQIQAQRCPNRPMVMIHGFLGAGDNYAAMANRLKMEGGYCNSYLQVYDWNTLARSTTEVLRLDSVIKAICASTGASQVDLVGHSAGGSLGYSYLSDSLRSSRVAHYIHIGSRPMPKPAGYKAGVATLNVYSTSDRTVQGADIPGATNARFSNYDHFGLVTADSTTMAILNFVEAAKTPATQKKSSTQKQTILLRIVQMGDNQADADATILCQRLNDNGEPEGSPQAATANAAGEVALTEIAPNSPYWITCQPRTGRAVAYYYPNISGGPLPLYLRTLPATGMVNLLLGGIPKSADAAAWALFNSNAAITPQKDVLILNGDTLNTSAITPPSKTVVALFLYDNGDKQTSKQPQGLFAQAPFMNGIDYYMPTTTAVQTLQWQQQKLQIPLVPASNFVTVVVLN